MENRNYMEFVIEVLQHDAPTLQEFLDFALDKAIELTESKVGYIYHYSEEKKRFMFNGCSKTERDIRCSEEGTNFERDCIWREVAEKKKAVILNDFEAFSSTKKDCIKIKKKFKRFLSIPVFKNDKIIAVVGMGNKVDEYTDEDVLKLRLMMDAVWKVVDQKKAEEDLRENEKLLNKVFDSIPIGLWFADKSGKLIRGNPAGVKIWGAEPKVGIEEYGVFKAKRLPSGQEIQPDEWALARTIRDGVTITDELLEIEAFDGKKKIIINHSIPVYDENKEISGAIVINQDVTQKIKAEEERKNNEDKYLLIAENMTNIITMLDMDLNYTFVTPNVEKIHGFKPEEFLDLKIQEALTPDSLREIMKVFEEEMVIEMSGTGDSDRIRIFELEEYKKDGTTLWMENVVSFIRNDHGTPIGILTVSRDISERKEAEKEQEMLQAQLIMAQKMESIGRLAGGIAHDFNNMLSVIMGRVELLLLKIDQGHPFFSDLLQVKNAAERSANLTSQLLAFARKQVVAPKVIDLNDSLRKMLEMMKRLIGENVKLDLDLSEDLWPVKIDPTQLDQVVANLTVNARDAVGQKGLLRFCTENVVILKDRPEGLPGIKKGEYVLLRVLDDGCGMTEEVLDKVFEPFFTTKKPGEGTGLGLSTIYGIVKQNDGYIYAFSELGKGSEFQIYLPKEAKKVKKKGAVDYERGAHKKGQTILFVEDEISILEIGSETLESFGYNVVSAYDPKNAIKLAQDFEGEIDLLITDVIMPGMNGKELERILKDIYPDIKVVFMSGYTSDIISSEGVIEHETNFIQKPFSQKELSEIVKKALIQ